MYCNYRFSNPFQILSLGFIPKIFLKASLKAYLHIAYELKKMETSRDNTIQEICVLRLQLKAVNNCRSFCSATTVIGAT